MPASKLSPSVVSSAIFSEDRVYRYVATRRWREGGRSRLWIMLNPSIADEVQNDPTVERCQRRTIEDGFNAMVVCNLFALVSTDPKALRTHPEPIGPLNDDHILEQASQAQQVVVGWGANGAFRKRGAEVLHLLLLHSIEVHALKLTKDGHPNHPLYVNYTIKPTPIYSA